MELTGFTCHQVLIYEDHSGVNEVHQLLIHQRNKPWSLTQREHLPSGLVQFISRSILLQCASTLWEPKISNSSKVFNSLQLNVSGSRDHASEPSLNPSLSNRAILRTGHICAVIPHKRVHHRTQFLSLVLGESRLFGATANSCQTLFMVVNKTMVG